MKNCTKTVTKIIKQCLENPEPGDTERQRAELEEVEREVEKEAAKEALTSAKEEALTPSPNMPF